jgi:hypothetical protein
MTLMSHEETTIGYSSQRDQGDDPGPPHPSAHLPRDTSTDICGWPMHYPFQISLQVWWDSFRLSDLRNY